MRREIADKLPEIKRAVKDFVADESGSVSKDRILKASIAFGVTAALLSQPVSAFWICNHGESITTDWNPGTKTISATHTHHASYSSSSGNC